MAGYKQIVTRTHDEALADDGHAVQQDTKNISTDTVADSRTTASNVVWYVFGVIAALLALRFILKMLAANPSNGIVNFVYSLSGVFNMPFSSIFGTTTVPAAQAQSIFEPSVLVAIAVYALIAWGLSRLFTLNRPGA